MISAGLSAFSQAAETSGTENQLEAQANGGQSESESSVKTKYKIGNIEYVSNGKTNVAALRRNVEINTELTFDTRKELEAYAKNIVQQLQNKRLFDEVTKESKDNEPDENGIVKVDYTITVTDSKNFMVFPKPNYSSNSGLELKVKLKDSNFLGFMNPLNVDLNGQLGTSSNPDDFSKVTIGTNFDYSFPFQIGITENSWDNEFKFDWLIGDVPEVSFKTGITTAIPFGKNKLKVNVAQSITRENDYARYGDEFFFTEAGGISLPLTLGYIGDVTPVRYTPSISATYNWDVNGINPSNSNLIGPDIKIKQELAISRVNWTGNFRNGYSLNLSHYIAYNFASEAIIPYLSVTAQFFKSFKYVGINARFFGYGEINKETNEIGSKLRGILDNQKFLGSTRKALSTNAALQFSLDIPIHIVTTDWLGWAASIFGTYDSQKPGMQKFLSFPRKVFRQLNFELQLSPFIDIALTDNRITGRTFSFLDGLYDAGIEVLIFPTKFKNYVVRASLGFDMGRTLLKDVVDMSWRDPNVKVYELFFGLGLQF